MNTKDMNIGDVSLCIRKSECEVIAFFGGDMIVIISSVQFGYPLKRFIQF